MDIGNSTNYLGMKMYIRITQVRRAWILTPQYLLLTVKVRSSVPVLLFSKLNKIFFGYFDPQNIFLDNEVK